MMFCFLEGTGVNGDRERPVVVGLRKGVESGLVEMLQGQGDMMKTFPFTFLQDATSRTDRVFQAMLSLTPSFPIPAMA